MNLMIAPILNFQDPTTFKLHRMWRFKNGYGVSAVRGPDTFMTSSGLWSVAVIKFHGPMITDYDVDYDNDLCRETDSVFHNVPDNQVDAIVRRVQAIGSCQDSN